MKVRIPAIQIIDRLCGVLGVAAGWDTAPTNLENATDGDWTTTATGVGINTGVVAYGYTGSIVFDMGAAYSVLLRGLITIGNTLGGGGLVHLIIDVSPDNSTWVQVDISTLGSLDAFLINADLTFYFVESLRNRYIRFRCRNDASETDLRLGLTEVQALDLAID